MEKKKAPVVVSDINVTPMVDVMLVLLIIFMVITPMLTKGQSVDLPRAKSAIAMKAADKEDAILVAITKNGVFLVGSHHGDGGFGARKVHALALGQHGRDHHEDDQQ